MWRAASAMFLALAIPASFPAMSGNTLRQRYGQPISETFLVRTGIVATATYGPDGETCELVVEPQQTSALIKNFSGTKTIPYETLRAVEDELVPDSERGKSLMGAILNIGCLPDNNCAGSEHDWENVVEYDNAGTDGAHYAVIRRLRDECKQTTP